MSPTQAAIFCNIREALAHGVDFEVGNDVIVFDELADIATAEPVAANRNSTEPNPNTKPAGQPATMVKYPIRGGFVPLGAKRADGSPHPHAGTGFGLSLSQAWKPLQDGPPPYLQNSYAGGEAYSRLELQQYSFDGTTFRVDSTKSFAVDELVDGWRISNGSMTNAIADGDDLLVTVVAADRKTLPPKRFSGAGLVRMRRQNNRWSPVELIPILPLTQIIEPSVVRDVDGSLLAAARRSGDDRRHDIHVVRSDDGGRTWQDCVEAKTVVGAGPITINQASDGTPYIAANLHSVLPGPRDPLTLTALQRRRQPEPAGNNRNTLSVWPLTADRTKLAAKFDVLDCRAEFGPPQGSNWTWRADHPSGMTVRLADGKWHHLLGFRVQDYREIKEAMPPTPRTGMYVQEILSSGPIHPVWKF
ncbi:MAG: exo-alpha-sialidase [Pirellulales bacterium]